MSRAIAIFPLSLPLLLFFLLPLLFLDLVSAPSLASPPHAALRHVTPVRPLLATLPLPLGLAQPAIRLEHILALLHSTATLLYRRAHRIFAFGFAEARQPSEHYSPTNLAHILFETMTPRSVRAIPRNVDPKRSSRLLETGLRALRARHSSCPPDPLRTLSLLAILAPLVPLAVLPIYLIVLRGVRRIRTLL